jgi:hypothetical protein
VTYLEMTALDELNPADAVPGLTPWGVALAIGAE